MADKCATPFQLAASEHKIHIAKITFGEMTVDVLPNYHMHIYFSNP